MSNVEHYFENMILSCGANHDDVNLLNLTEGEIAAVKDCYNYLAYTLFANAEELKRFAEEK